MAVVAVSGLIKNEVGTQVIKSSKTRKENDGITDSIALRESPYNGML